MLDLQHLPPGANVQLFTNPNSTQQWIKPRGAQLIFINVRGAGGGGGGGTTGASATARGGGGGAYAGNFCSGIFPAILVPDMLFVRAGLGGLGGIASANGVSGLTSYVSVHPTVLIQHSSLAQAGGGGQGLASGSFPSVGGQGFILGNSLSLVTSSNGQTGGPAGASTGGPGGTLSGGEVLLISGGLGGAGVGTANTDYPGGNFTSTSVLYPSVAGGLAGGGAGIDSREVFIAGAGGDLGLMSLISVATGGGSSGASGTGGRGGRGLKGSGGGGGGGGVTGGAGGRGGDGYVVIISV